MCPKLTSEHWHHQNQVVKKVIFVWLYYSKFAFAFPQSLQEDCHHPECINFIFNNRNAFILHCTHQNGCNYIYYRNAFCFSSNSTEQPFSLLISHVYFYFFLMKNGLSLLIMYFFFFSPQKTVFATPLALFCSLSVSVKQPSVFVNEFILQQ